MDVVGGANHMDGKLIGGQPMGFAVGMPDSPIPENVAQQNHHLPNFEIAYDYSI